MPFRTLLHKLVQKLSNSCNGYQKAGEAFAIWETCLRPAESLRFAIATLQPESRAASVSIALNDDGACKLWCCVQGTVAPL